MADKWVDTDLEPVHMRYWLLREKALVKTAMEERLKEATELTQAYSRGELSKEVANNRLETYNAKWPTRFCLDDNIQDRIEDKVARITEGQGPSLD